MKKIDLGQLLSILANVGVIVGIAFLAFELRQNNALLGAQARTARASIPIDASNITVGTPELWRALMKDRSGHDLTAGEEFLLQEWHWGTLIRWQYVFGEYEAGLLEREDLPTEQWRFTFMTNSEMAEFWEDRKDAAFRSDFVEFMEVDVIY